MRTIALIVTATARAVILVWPPLMSLRIASTTKKGGHEVLGFAEDLVPGFEELSIGGGSRAGEPLE